MSENNNPSKFIVCVDSSESSKQALKFACLKAKRRGFNLSLLHVIEPVDFRSISSVEEKMREESRKEAEKLLSDLADFAYDTAGIRVTYILKEGVIEEQIAQAAKEDSEVNMLMLGLKEKNKKSGKVIEWLGSKLGDELPIPLMLIPCGLSDEQILETI